MKYISWRSRSSRSASALISSFKSSISYPAFIYIANIRDSAIIIRPLVTKALVMVRIKIESVHTSREAAPVWVDIEGIGSADIKTVRKSLASGLKSGSPSDAVAHAFVEAVACCPKANPSDIWQHVIYRSALLLGLSDQQWKRISGFALERALTEIYTPRLAPYNLRIRAMRRIQNAYEDLGLASDVKPDKIDRAVEAYRQEGDGYRLIAGLHVKASIAERIQDDVPASRALMSRGILSIMLTMDSKSYPPPHGDGVNYGELGGRSWDVGKERVRIKRQYVEEDGQFDALISYNLRTPPSGEVTRSGKRIFTISLSEPQPDILVKMLKDRADTLG